MAAISALDDSASTCIETVPLVLAGMPSRAEISRPLASRVNLAGPALRGKSTGRAAGSNPRGNSPLAVTSALAQVPVSRSSNSDPSFSCASSCKFDTASTEPLRSAMVAVGSMRWRLPRASPVTMIWPLAFIPGCQWGMSRGKLSRANSPLTLMTPWVDFGSSGRLPSSNSFEPAATSWIGFSVKVPLVKSASRGPWVVTDSLFHLTSNGSAVRDAEPFCQWSSSPWPLMVARIAPVSGTRRSRGSALACRVKVAACGASMRIWPAAVVSYLGALALMSAT